MDLYNCYHDKKEKVFSYIKLGMDRRFKADVLNSYYEE